MNTHASHDRPLFRLVSPLILASASPRRKDLLAAWGIALTIHTPRPQAEPLPLPNQDARTHALKAAAAKVLDVRETYKSQEDAVFLGVDTAVEVEGKMLGKPRDVDEALAFLRLLNGAENTVHTACVLLGSFGRREIVTSTRVRFGSFDEAVLRAYAACGEGLDKAGGYAVQGRGAFLVARVEGSVTGVVGLPVSELLTLLMEVNVLVPYQQQEGSICTGAIG